MGFSLLLLGIAGLCLLAWQAVPADRRRPAQRMILIAGLACGPYGLFSYMYIPKYWQPVLTSWLGTASPEDILFAIGTAAIAVSLALWPYRHRLELPPPDWGRFFQRYCTFAAVGIGLGFGILYAVQWRIDTMFACLISIAAAGAVVVFSRPDLLRLSLPGLLFVPFYWLALHLAFVIWPDFAAAWGRATTQHIWISGVPLYELLWGAGLGASWAPFIGWCLGLKLQEREAAA
jgi:hypothetical protein